MSLRIIIAQILLWTGVGSLVIVASGQVFYWTYGSQFSGKGVAIILAYSVPAILVGGQFSVLRWMQVGAIALVLLGLPLAVGPVRSFPIPEWDLKDLVLFLMGTTLIVLGFGILHHVRGTSH